MSAVIELRRTDLDSDAAQHLINALNAELTALYPEEGVNYFRLDAEDVRPGRGAFFVAYVAGAPVGCGAVRLLDRHTAEIKRMYVAPEMRRQGVARRLLEALEREARLLAVTRILLETGTRQPEAIALYLRGGFSATTPFGEYKGSPLNTCMEKQVGAG